MSQETKIARLETLNARVLPESAPATRIDAYLTAQARRYEGVR
jgi:hypothetical protein